jgi:hypothetical protein
LKGYAVDRWYRFFGKTWIRSGLITAGSSSIYGIGVPPTGCRDGAWRSSTLNTRRSVEEVFPQRHVHVDLWQLREVFRVRAKVYSHIWTLELATRARNLSLSL